MAKFGKRPLWWWLLFIIALAMIASWYQKPAPLTRQVLHIDQQRVVV